MNSSTLLEQMEAALDGELSGAALQNLQQRIAGDDSTRAQQRELAEQHDALDRWFAEEAESMAGLEDRLLSALPLAPSHPPIRLTPATTRVPASSTNRTLVRWRIAAGWLLTAAAAFGSGWWFSGGAEVAPVEPIAQRESAAASLAAAIGLVEVRAADASSFTPLATGSEIAHGATVRTSSDAKAAFRLTDGSQVRLNAASEATFVHTDRVVLLRGDLFANVQSEKPRLTEAGPHQVSATTSSFQLSHQLRDAQPVTDLVVLSGEATWADQLIEAGHAARAQGSAVSPQRRARDVLLTTSWINDLLTLQGIDTDELQERVEGLLATLGRTKAESMYEWEIRSLGDRCVLPLISFLRATPGTSGRDHFLREKAARILRDLATQPFLRELLPLLEHADPNVRGHVAAALARITGDALGFTEEEWRGEDFAKGVAAWKRWAEEYLREAMN